MMMHLAVSKADASSDRAQGTEDLGRRVGR